MEKPGFITEQFVESLMRTHAPEGNIRVQEVRPLAIDNSASILSVLTAGRSERPLGHFGLQVSYEEKGQPLSRNLVLKVKPHGQEIVEMLNALAAACGEKLAPVYAQFKFLTGFQHTHRRELEVYAKLRAPLQPQIFGLLADEENGAYYILMEYLQEVELMNSSMEPHKWTDKHIKEALKQLAGWHASQLEKETKLDNVYWDDAPCAVYMEKLRPLWQALLENASQNFPNLYSPTRKARLQKAIDSIPTYWQELEKMPKTLVHNDCNPRNICFKRTGSGTGSFCLYDWELATWHVPQYDVVELLSFVLDSDKYHLRPKYLEFYRQQLEELTGKFSDKGAFERGAELAAYDFGLHRLGMYMMAHTVSPYPFLPRVVNSYFDGLAVSKEQLAIS